MGDRWDVIVVGARLAGATLAGFLGQAGARVLLLDRARFPSPCPRQGSWARETNLRWERLGVLPAIEALGAPKRTGQHCAVGEVVISYRRPQPDPLTFAMTVRRERLDHALASYAAGLSGVELREGCRAGGLLWEGDRVAGVRMELDADRTVVERAPLVVGADGRNSWLARQVRAAIHAQVASPWATCFADWSGTALEADMDSYVWSDIGVLTAAPVDCGLVTAAVSVRQEEWEEFRHGLPGTYEARLRRHPHMAALLERARRETQVFGGFGLHMFRRQAAGPGWALVGDAGYHLDPVTARGAKAAVAAADVLAQAILNGELEQYQARRDALLAPDWDYTAGQLQAGPPTAEEMGLARFLAKHPTLCGLYAEYLAGQVPAGQFRQALLEALRGAP